MTHPHQYDPQTAPYVYLYREYVESRPKQITFCGMVGSFRLHVLDLSNYRRDFELFNVHTEAIIEKEIINDRSNRTLDLYGEVSYYVLVIAGKPIAKYSPSGEFIGDASDVSLTKIQSSVISGDEKTEFRIR